MIVIKTTLDSFIAMGKHEHNIGSAISTQMAVKQLSYYVATCSASTSFLRNLDRNQLIAGVYYTHWPVWFSACMAVRGGGPILSII